MTDFWWGFLALPLVIAGAAVLVILVLGAWHVTDLWRSRRITRMRETARWPLKSVENEPGKMPLAWVGWAGSLGDRGGAASAMLTWPNAWSFQVWPGAALVFTWGGGKSDPQLRRNVQRAILKAMEDINNDEEIAVAKRTA